MLDSLINEFDLALVSRDDGYMRTDWLYSYGNRYDFQCRLRVTIRFSADRRSVHLKTDAQHKHGENWIMGVDSQLLTTLKTDLMGKLGRTTR